MDNRLREMILDNSLAALGGILIVVGVLLIVTGCAPSTPKTKPKVVNYSGIESGQPDSLCYIDTIHTDGTEAGTVAEVASWVESHPQCEIQTISPLTKGGEMPRHIREYLIVAKIKKANRGKQRKKD